jgi:hypothetical protein
MDFSLQWHTLGREAELAAAQIAVGVTALGRANHSRLGNYAIAFFGLATGLERLGKLIVIADYAIGNRGKLPENKILKGFSHDLEKLLNHCEDMSSRRQSPSEYAKRPNERVHQGIIQTLSEFSELSRYYNLDLLTGGKAASLPEPVGAWWRRVAEPILSQHYAVSQRKKDNAIANGLDKMWREHAHILHHSELGETMNDFATLFRHAGATRVVQNYGRLYVLQIVRWLNYTLSVLVFEAAYTHRLEPFFGLEEPFKVFLNDDHYFRTRKTWAIYR